MSKKIDILLVEDDHNLGVVLQDSLDLMGYRVDLAEDGKEGLRMFSQGGEYDLCLVDVMLPRKDGFSLVEDIKKIDENIPVIFLTARGMEEDRIRGFEVGADDYVTKPFSVEELHLRIKAILKRVGKIEKTEYKTNGIITIGKYHFDTENYQLILEDDKRKLTKKEVEILKLLSRKKGKVVERSVILNTVWGDDNYFNGRSLDVFMTKLRKYLKEDEAIQIKNIHGIGFILSD